jgi:hypothetical protein
MNITAPNLSSTSGIKAKPLAPGHPEFYGLPDDLRHILGAGFGDFFEFPFFLVAYAQ